MSRHFLKYWLPESITPSLELPNQLFKHAASDQYKRVSVGDELWGVTVESGRLYLFGHMKIHRTLSRDEAAAQLELTEERLMEGEVHVVPEIPELIDFIDITDIAPELRFVSSRDRLVFTDSTFDVQQLRTMRELTLETGLLFQEIWNDAQQPKDEQPGQSYVEGKRELRVHYQRERNRSLVAHAKRDFIDKNGSLYCEVCGFSFSKKYGDLGMNFIEAHHRKPLSEAQEATVETSIEDLAMVCANCHRMLHRQKPWLSIDELRDILERNGGERG
jgi:hypothetical protein